MSKPTCEIIIYTANGALQFNVIVSCDNFKDKLAEALENGTVTLDTVEGNRLILSAVNVVAIEINEEISPPLEKNQ